MNLDWQNIAAVSIVAGAVAYAAWRIRRVGKPGSARPCAGCSTCGSQRQRKQLVSLEPPPPSSSSFEDRQGDEITA